MIYKLDHIGITVESLAEARRRLDGVHPCFHAQHGMGVRDALIEVSLHRPERLSISLHRKQNNIDIELIEYPRLSKKTGSMFPWRLDPAELPGSLNVLKRAVREQIERSLGGYTFEDIVALLETHTVFNAMVVPVEDLAAEERFWQGLRFKTLHADGEMVILGLKSLVPPGQSDYILLYKVDYAIPYHTDLEGINEIALLCNSCSADLKAFPQDVFKSTVDRFLVDGKAVDLGYLRSPSGVLAELFSVRLAAP